MDVSSVNVTQTGRRNNIGPGACCATRSSPRCSWSWSAARGLGM